MISLPLGIGVSQLGVSSESIIGVATYTSQIMHASIPPLFLSLCYAHLISHSRICLLHLSHEDGFEKYQDRSRQTLRKFSQSPLCTGRCGCCLFLYRNHIWLAGKRRENHRTLRAARRVGATVIFFLSIFRIFFCDKYPAKKSGKTSRFRPSFFTIDDWILRLKIRAPFLFFIAVVARTVRIRLPSLADIFGSLFRSLLTCKVYCILAG